jgi:nicotinamide mononucleotide adenylyltransferase
LTRISFPDLQPLLQRHGLVCVSRSGADPGLREAGGALAAPGARVAVAEERIPNAVSSSAVRQEVAAGRTVRYLVPEPVRQYILREGLYCRPDAAPTPPAR